MCLCNAEKTWLDFTSNPAVYLFNIVQSQGNSDQEFPHTGCQVEIQGFLCSYGHPKQYPKELKHCKVIFSRTRWVQ